MKPITAETAAIQIQMITIENQNLCDEFRLGLGRSAILLELVPFVECVGGLRLIA